MAQWFGQDKIAIIHQNVQKVSVFKESITRFGVLWMKRPMEHYLDDLRPVYISLQRIIRNQGVM